MTKKQNNIIKNLKRAFPVNGRALEPLFQRIVTIE